MNSVDGMLRCEVSKFNTKELYYSRMVQSLANDDDTLHAGMVQEEIVLLCSFCIKMKSNSLEILNLPHSHVCVEEEFICLISL